MRYDPLIRLGGALLAAAVAFPAYAAMYKWVDENGKVQYGDTIPPQYRKQGSEELSKRGVVTKTFDSPLTPEQQKAKAEEDARLKAQKQKEAEQSRRDTALLATYSNEQEIDLKRDRELKVIEGSKDPIRMSLKIVSDRIAGLQKSAPPSGKDGKASTGATDDMARAQADKRRLEQQLADKDKEIEALRADYADQKKRFLELKSAKK